MLTFDFECQKCQTIFEKIVSKSDAIVICPKCKSDFCKKMISGPSFYVKGYSAKNGYSKKNLSSEEIIKQGPQKSVAQLQQNLRK